MPVLRSLDDLRALARQERRRRGLTQAEAAGLIGHTQKWLSDFETGKSDPPTSMTLKLMVLLGIPLQAETAAPGGGSAPGTAEGEREIDIDEGL